MHSRAGTIYFHLSPPVSTYFLPNPTSNLQPPRRFYDFTILRFDKRGMHSRAGTIYFHLSPPVSTYFLATGITGPISRPTDAGMALLIFEVEPPGVFPSWESA